MHVGGVVVNYISPPSWEAMGSFPISTLWLMTYMVPSEVRYCVSSCNLRCRLISLHGCFRNCRVTCMGAGLDLYVVSQLYGSTTVVMATHGLHWKWQSLTPCQRHPSEPIEKIFGTIDYVIDLNNLAKFGFGKIFPDGGTHTQHIRVRPFFSFFFFFNFLRSLMRVQPKRPNRFWRAIRQSTPFGESQTLF